MVVEPDLRSLEEVSHTPGPWMIRVAPNGDCGIKADGTGWFIESFADIRHAYEGAGDEALANARLIAAAPELLDALKDYDNAFTDLNPDDKASRHTMRLAIIKARAAIIKATTSSADAKHQAAPINTGVQS